MLKCVLLSIGLLFVFEGLVYFILSNRINLLIDTFKSLEPQKIRFFSGISIITGLTFIYLTLKFFSL